MNDVKLLPLPASRNTVLIRGEGHSGEISASPCEHYFDPDTVLDYARACVDHATAAKDAEIEALRAEWLKALGLAMQARAELKEWHGAAEIHKAHAERLAEALRIAHRHLDMDSMRVSHCNDEKAIRAALQEPSHD